MLLNVNYISKSQKIQLVRLYVQISNKVALFVITVSNALLLAPLVICVDFHVHVTVLVLV